MRLDARIPVRLVVPGEDGFPAADPVGVLLIAGLAVAAPEGAWLAVRGFDAARLAVAEVPHPLGCACCVERDPLAVLLSTLFEHRARGALGLFQRVWLAVPRPLIEAARRVVVSDRVVAGRYRVGEN